MSETCRMILDVDTGIDDAMAIFYAVRHPGIALEAVTTTFGNIDTAGATRNTLQVLELLGHPDIPVAKGVERSLITPFHGGAAHVHGHNGIGDIDLPLPAIRETGEHAVDCMIRTIKENPGEITLCPVGPITNVALAIAKAPEIAGLAKGIVIMGSTIDHPGIQGIPSPKADANFYNDPEAAHIVLTSGADITLVGMDVTMPTMLTRKMMQAISGSGDAAAKVLMDMTAFYVKAYETMYPGIDGCGLHDPLAVAIAQDPGLAVTEDMTVDIELHGGLTRGETVADRRRTAVDLPKAHVCRDVDRPRFLDLFERAMTNRF